MGSKSKDKGSAAERDVADILFRWSGKAFSRCPNSGALRWGNGFWTYGDIIPPEDFPLVFESKHYAEVMFDDVLGRRTNKSKVNPNPEPSFGTGLVTEWWSQVSNDAARATAELGKHISPVLLWKQDYHRHRICLQSSLYQNIDPAIRKTLVCCWTYVPDREPFIMLDLDLFLSKVSPCELLAAHEKLHKISPKHS